MSYELIDVPLFFVSVFLSSVGSLLDNYTTKILVSNLGIEFEANKRVRDIIMKYGYKTKVLLEAFLIVLVGIIDSFNLMSTYWFLGLFFLIVRGMTAGHNLKIIIEYRKMGKVTFEEGAFQNVSLKKRIRSISLYLVEAFICLLTYIVLLTIDFHLVVLIRSTVLGLSFYFILIACYSLN